MGHQCQVNLRPNVVFNDTNIFDEESQSVNPVVSQPINQSIWGIFVFLRTFIKGLKLQYL